MKRCIIGGLVGLALWLWIVLVAIVAWNVQPGPSSLEQFLIAVIGSLMPVFALFGLAHAP